MKTAIASIALLAIVASPAYAAPDAKVVTKVEVKGTVKVVAPASQPAASQPVLPTQVPKDVTEAVKLAKDVFASGKARNWWLVSAGIIWLLMFVVKLVGLLNKLGRRWGYIIVAGLSMVAMLLAKFGGGISWEGAIVVMTSGPFMAYANDLVKRGILGQEPENTVTK